MYCFYSFKTINLSEVSKDHQAHVLPKLMDHSTPGPAHASTHPGCYRFIPLPSILYIPPSGLNNLLSYSNVTISTYMPVEDRHPPISRFLLRFLRIREFFLPKRELFTSCAIVLFGGWADISAFSSLPYPVKRLCDSLL